MYLAKGGFFTILFLTNRQDLEAEQISNMDGTSVVVRTHMEQRFPPEGEVNEVKVIHHA